jgi:hypothetical protein
MDTPPVQPELIAAKRAGQLDLVEDCRSRLDPEGHVEHVERVANRDSQRRQGVVSARTGSGGHGCGHGGGKNLCKPPFDGPRTVHTRSGHANGYNPTSRINWNHHPFLNTAML